MKTIRIAVVCALCVVIGVGCGKKEAEEPTAVEQEEETGNVVLDNLASEPEPL